jgi:hypothetical protein
MNHGRWTVLLDRLVERSQIKDVSDDERSPTYEISVSAGQIVKSDGCQTGSGQSLASVTANISGTACNQDV